MTDFFLRYVHGQYAFVLIPLLCILFAYRRWWWQPVYYMYTLVHAMPMLCTQKIPFSRIITTFLRIAVLAILSFLLLRPQMVDMRSQITVDGIDIVLVLDASGSMQFRDYDDEQRSRFDVAKDEAIRFINMRNNDAIGMVIFGADAVSRCPITSDKTMLKKLINELQIGVVNPDGTVLVRGMIAAANRLKNSPAASKIMIVLTDGEPSEHDLEPSVAVKIAQELGIKIYTVGIGSQKEEYFMHPFYGLMQKPKVNVALLEHIAKQTGGRFFMAHNASDMRAIYTTIDQLEKTSHEVPLFSRYFELIDPIGLVALLLLVLELIISALWIWL